MEYKLHYTPRPIATDISATPEDIKHSEMYVSFPNKAHIALCKRWQGLGQWQGTTVNQSGGDSNYTYCSRSSVIPKIITTALHLLFFWKMLSKMILKSREPRRPSTSTWKAQQYTFAILPRGNAKSPTDCHHLNHAHLLHIALVLCVDHIMSQHLFSRNQ